MQGRLELDNKRLQIDAMNKAGQLQQQKSAANISAMGKAGDIKTKREQMQMTERQQSVQRIHDLTNKQKEPPKQ